MFSPSRYAHRIFPKAIKPLTFDLRKPNSHKVPEKERKWERVRDFFRIAISYDLICTDRPTDSDIFFWEGFKRSFTANVFQSKHFKENCSSNDCTINKNQIETVIMMKRYNNNNKTLAKNKKLVLHLLHS